MYHLFMGECYYPWGGARDHVKSYVSLRAAKAAAKRRFKLDSSLDWANILTPDGAVVDVEAPERPKEEDADYSTSGETGSTTMAINESTMPLPAFTVIEAEPPQRSSFWDYPPFCWFA